MQLPITTAASNHPEHLAPLSFFSDSNLHYWLDAVLYIIMRCDARQARASGKRFCLCYSAYSTQTEWRREVTPNSVLIFIDFLCRLFHGRLKGAARCASLSCSASQQW